MTRDQQVGASGFRAWTRNPAFARIAPFLAFVIVLALTPMMTGAWPAGHEALAQWLHPLKGLVAGVLLVCFWRRYEELGTKTEPRLTWFVLSAALGFAVFALWISLDAPWMILGSTTYFAPIHAEHEALDTVLTASRLVGLIAVVPIMEELFWRSFLMRWLSNHDFLSVDPRTVRSFAFWSTAILFAAEHHLWLAGLIAGVVFNWLYTRSGSLWPPIIAHTVANACLGVYIVIYNRWDLW